MCADSRQSRAGFRAVSPPFLPLIGIELRRNAGWLLLPIIAMTVGWMTLQAQLQGVVLWPKSVQGIAFSLAVIGPLVAALACWQAGRSRRAAMGDLLRATALSPEWSVWAGWLGVAIWGVVAYGLAAAAALTWTATEATWGRPLLAPIIVAAVAIPVCAAAGTLAGACSSNRLLPPIVALLTAGLLILPNTDRRLEPYILLSPMSVISRLMTADFAEVDERMIGPHLLWLAALGGVCLGGAALRRSSSMLPHVLLTMSIVVGVLLGGRLGTASPAERQLVGRPLAYAPVCQTEVVTVCVHPAYAALLPATSARINRVVTPIAGLPGVPGRYAQVARWSADVAPDARFQLYDASSFAHGDFQWQLARQLVVDPSLNLPIELQRRGAFFNNAQCVVAMWLAVESGWERSIRFCWTVEAAAAQSSARSAGHGREAMLRPMFDAQKVAFERFDALDRTARASWLYAHWTDLRAGRLTLADLP